MGAALDKIVIIGHRGTGKTSLLKRWKKYCPDFDFADLDEEIEKSAGISITQIFTDKGEEHFRYLEKKIWENLQTKHVISVGGGFDLKLISQDWKILWVKRDSDGPDRIFLDRPSLSDYKSRFEAREKSFQEKADLIYTIPEGLFSEDEEEKKILMEKFSGVGGVVTLPTRIYPDSLIEVRDDLEMRLYETPNLLYSVRSGNTFPKNAKVDWDIKKPIPNGFTPYIISTHENSFDVFATFEGKESLLKFCPIVKTWKELREGYKWQNKNPQKRIFLPRSENGKWTWFRLWMKGKQSLNFWREGSGSAADQPTLWEWMSHPDNVTQFAAVLGSPVRHSYSPAYHKSFFKKKGMPFYRIDIQESEWSEALSFLDELGLSAAAVTSPLKSKAGEFVGQKPLNTLWKKEGQWQGANTDKIGASALLNDFENQECVVWGGGGVLETLKEVLPNAVFYSSQKGIPRENSRDTQNPQVLIWGDPHNSVEKVPASWKPETVVDLSYHDKSPARLYALKVNARYVSGLTMFLKQAEAQQKTWSRT